MKVMFNISLAERGKKVSRRQREGTGRGRRSGELAEGAGGAVDSKDMRFAHRRRGPGEGDRLR